ncbi:hypothetical protein OS965_02585 [Streptomyces sp. H27-G5]|uniref:hypothetical protein n=1 Tax=Streptomyces sp. H27-G5 TaxID=2996698 RepID=UPI00226ED9D7|nr:hypothetical protein [Streptomyces sp. H27-G5]MCY0917064.1 hypothetical protein [Streptomyces sp. H27-G5]
MPRTVPVPATEAPGLYNTAALFNAQVRDLNSFALGVPVFRGYQSSAQSCATGTWVSIAIDTETLDSDGGHSTVTNNSRYTPTVAGTYLAIGTVAFAASGSSQRATRLTMNGSPSVGAAEASAAGGSWWCGSGIELFACNGTTDYIELQGRQDSGGTISTYVGTEFNCALKIFWISR